MYRKLFVALVLAVLPMTGANALGLGGITLNSKLNQPLNAEIRLLSVEPGDLEKLRISLASREEFEQAGLDRPFLLASMQFAAEGRADGSYIIRVTTKDAFREPFVSFLLKVEWPNGRLLREYTMLVDPPVLTREVAPSIQAPAAQPEAPAMAPEPGVAVGARPSGGPRPLPPVQPAAVQPVAPAMGSAPGEYLVRRGDNLYTIARSLADEPGVSIEQAMLAYQRANPDAFINDNINLLKEGYVLRTPSATEATELEQAAAIAAVRRQMAAWRTFKQEVAGTPPAAAGAGVAAAPQTRLEVVTPRAADGSAVAGAGEGEAGAAVEGLQRDLALATEAAEARRLENEDLQGQVEDLEKRLADMQSVVTVKVEELAALQARLREAGVDPEAAQLPGEQAQMPATEPEQAREGEQAMAAAPAEPAQPAPPPAAEATPAPSPQPEPQPVAAQQAETGEMDPMAFASQLFDTVMADPIMLGAVGGGLVLLLVLLLVMVRRRRAAEADDELFAAAGLGAEGEALEAAGEAGEDEMAIEDFAEALEGEEAEEGEKSGVEQVIAEADVYLAYGRYQQAEELIGTALKEHPRRLDLKSKLLEVHFATRDKEAFEILAADIHDDLQEGGGAEWDKYLLMGRDLCPNNPLFAETSDTSALGVPVTTGVPSGALDTGIQFDPFADDEGPAQETPAREKPSYEGGMDFEATAKGDETRQMAAEETAEDDGLDFDFDFGEEEGAEVESEGEPSGMLEVELTRGDDADLSLAFPAPDLEEGDEEDESLDFDFAETAKGGDAGTEEKDEEEFDLELHTIETQAVDVGAEAGEEKAETAAEDEEPGRASMADDKDFSIEWDITGMGAEGEEDKGSESINDLEETAVLDFREVPLDDESSDADMVATKLDLAKAYMDMGDAEGARNILDEVVKEGSEAQRKEAQQLISSL